MKLYSQKWELRWRFYESSHVMRVKTEEFKTHKAAMNKILQLKKNKEMFDITLFAKVVWEK